MAALPFQPRSMAVLITMESEGTIQERLKTRMKVAMKAKAKQEMLKDAAEQKAAAELTRWGESSEPSRVQALDQNK